MFRSFLSALLSRLVNVGPDNQSPSIVEDYYNGSIPQTHIDFIGREPLTRLSSPAPVAVLPRESSQISHSFLADKLPLEIRQQI